MSASIKPLKSCSANVWPQHLWPSGYFPSSKATHRSWRWSFHCTPVIGSYATGWSVSKYMPSYLLNNLLFCLVYLHDLSKSQWNDTDEWYLSCFTSSNGTMSWFPFSKAAISVGVAEKKAMRKLFSVCSKTSKLSAFRQILYKHENRKKRTWKKRVATVNSQQKRIMYNSWICLVTPASSRQAIQEKTCAS